MKKFILLSLLAATFYLWAEPVTPPPKTTSYTRNILTATNAADFASKSGISTNGTTTNGIVSLNLETAPNQTITISTNSNPTAISDNTTNHTINIPYQLIDTTNPVGRVVAVPTFAANTNGDLWYNRGTGAGTNWVHFIAQP